MSTCRQTFEPVVQTPAQRAKTHTCNRTQGHEPPHHCPVCGADWIRDEAGGVVFLTSVTTPARIRLGSCCINVGTDACECDEPTNWGLDTTVTPPARCGA